MYYKAQAIIDFMRYLERKIDWAIETRHRKEEKRLKMIYNYLGNRNGYFD